MTSNEAVHILIKMVTFSISFRIYTYVRSYIETPIINETT